MPPADTPRNRRIVRLRDGKIASSHNIDGGWTFSLKKEGVKMSWRAIAERIAVEFPDEAIGHKRCQDIYNYIVNNRPPALNGGAWRRAQKKKEDGSG